ncbi:hypothetical protein Tco_1577719 [Tanacetum coccineum]
MLRGTPVISAGFQAKISKFCLSKEHSSLRPFFVNVGSYATSIGEIISTFIDVAGSFLPNLLNTHPSLRGRGRGEGDLSFLSLLKTLSSADSLQAFYLIPDSIAVDHFAFTALSSSRPWGPFLPQCFLTATWDLFVVLPDRSAHGPALSTIGAFKVGTLDDISNLVDSMDGILHIGMGDFNAVKSISERAVSQFDANEAMSFSNFIANAERGLLSQNEIESRGDAFSINQRLEQIGPGHARRKGYQGRQTNPTVSLNAVLPPLASDTFYKDRCQWILSGCQVCFLSTRTSSVNTQLRADPNILQKKNTPICIAIRVQTTTFIYMKTIGIHVPFLENHAAYNSPKKSISRNEGDSSSFSKPPSKINWVIGSSSGEKWHAFADDTLVPDSTKLQWGNRFKFKFSINDAEHYASISG